MTNPTVLFDLDGTLLDSVHDLARALNLLLAQRQREPVTLDKIRQVVSHGRPGMLKLCFGVSEEDKEYHLLSQDFGKLYTRHLLTQPRLFPGVTTLLSQLEKRHIKWGIVTNKPTRFTKPIVKYLGWLSRAACVVCGDTFQYKKPHPQPILQACQQIPCRTDNTIFIGDADNDIIAGKAAGTKTIVALYGYLAEDDKPDAWQADDYVNCVDELLNKII
ncbi:MAG: HAD-IA family hydrolase [Gammaproteobacteria bacterium]|nr:HAD-IA family hydrolase [Gammaproteobacteria bacterium]